MPELRIDHQQITDKINENIQVLHSARLAPKSSVAKESGNSLLINIAAQLPKIKK